MLGVENFSHKKKLQRKVFSSGSMRLLSHNHQTLSRQLNGAVRALFQNQ